jgi:hypothetical protein
MYREKNDRSTTIFEQINPPEKSSSEFTDLPPEFCQYRDEGCSASPTCLYCPLPCCLYEEGCRRNKSLRDQEIVRLHNEEKQTLGELAVRFDLSQRTIRRVLKASQKTRE